MVEFYSWQHNKWYGVGQHQPLFSQEVALWLFHYGIAIVVAIITIQVLRDLYGGMISARYVRGYWRAYHGCVRVVRYPLGRPRRRVACHWGDTGRTKGKAAHN